MFKKLLASVGMGSAKVDTFILSEQLNPGGECNLRVVIQASDSVEQDINGLELALCTSAKSEKDLGDSEIKVNETVILSRWAMTPQELGLSNSILEAGQTIEYDLTISLHPETPVTAVANNLSKVWIATGLDIDKGLDSSDKEYLDIHPTSFQKHAVEAMYELGYKILKVDVEKGYLRGNGFQSSVNCYQEFEFKRQAGLFSSSEAELSFVNLDGAVGILVEKDRFLGGDAYFSEILPNNANYQQIKSKLEQWL